MTTGSFRVRLTELEAGHMTAMQQLFQLDEQTVQGYLAEEIFGWSMSRVVLGEEDRIVGLIQVHRINADQGYGVLGTWLVPKVWGTGVNASAKRLLLAELAVERPEIDKVYLCIEAGNTRSIRAARKLEFASEITADEVPAELAAEMEHETGSTDLIWFVCGAAGL